MTNDQYDVWGLVSQFSAFSQFLQILPGFEILFTGWCCKYSPSTKMCIFSGSSSVILLNGKPSNSSQNLVFGLFQFINARWRKFSPHWILFLLNAVCCSPPVWQSNNLRSFSLSFSRLADSNSCWLSINTIWANI